MYPLVVILFVGMQKKNKEIYWYVLPFSIVGEIIAIYHNLLYYKIIPESLAPCIQGVSCTTKLIEFFGFVTIPFLSLVAFTVINVCMILYIRSFSQKKKIKKS
jgi:disulfide bond formation protein DsbB